MASLLSIFGGNSSGTPFTLSDDEQAQLLAQQQAAQQDPTSGISALMGVSGQDSTSAQAQPTQAATQDANQSLLASVANPQSTAPDADSSDTTNSSANSGSANTGSDASPSYATASQTDQSGSGSDSNGSASASPDNTDNTSTATTAGTDPQPAASNSDAGTAGTSASSSAPVSQSAQTAQDSPGFLSKLMTEMRTNPTLGESLMNAGFGMMGASRYGTPGWAAVGQGAQVGLQTYNALKQQGIQNQMAQATGLIDNQKKQADLQTVQLSNQSKTALQKYSSQVGQNFTINGAIAAGALPADAISAYQGMHPNLTVQTDDAGNVYGVNPQTGQRVNLGSSTKLVTTPAGNTTTAYSGGGANGTPVTPQVVQQGGLAPADVNANVAKYQAPQAAAAKSEQSSAQFLNQLQSADALSGSGGGVIPNAVRNLVSKAGFYDPNSALHNQYAGQNVQAIVSSIPPGSRMDQNFLKLAAQGISDPGTASPEAMIRGTALLNSKQQYDQYDNEARAAFVAANGGMETPMKVTTPTTLNIGGKPMSLAPGTYTMQQVSDAATQKLVNWDPPLINPKWGDGKSQAQINQAMQFANSDPTKLAKLRQQGVLLPSNMRTGGQ
jgi:hypothetical protein